jgi:hypothetical protein
MTALQVLYVAVILSWIGLIGVAVTVVRLQNHLLKRTLDRNKSEDDSPSIGSPAPILGGTTSPWEAAHALPQLIWFMKSHCTPCRNARSLVKSISDDYEGRLECLVSYAGSEAEVPGFAQLWDARVKVIVDQDRGNAKHWRIRSVPSVFLVRSDGIIMWKASGTQKDLRRVLDALLPLNHAGFSGELVS